MSEHYFFVYGTLKRNEPNHHVLMGEDGTGVRFVGEAITMETYPLTIATSLNIPFLLLHDGSTGKRVKGEVYAVGEEAIPRMDELECYPRVYDKRQMEVSLLQASPDHKEGEGEGDTLACWLYGLTGFKPELLTKEPQLDSYTCHADHGLPFVTKAHREAHVTLEDVTRELFVAR